jgi:hypothetical protein
LRIVNTDYVDVLDRIAHTEEIDLMDEKKKLK